MTVCAGDIIWQCGCDASVFWLHWSVDQGRCSQQHSSRQVPQPITALVVLAYHQLLPASFLETVGKSASYITSPGISIKRDSAMCSATEGQWVVLTPCCSMLLGKVHVITVLSVCLWWYLIWSNQLLELVEWDDRTGLATGGQLLRCRMVAMVTSLIVMSDWLLWLRVTVWSHGEGPRHGYKVQPLQLCLVAICLHI